MIRTFIVGVRHALPVLVMLLFMTGIASAQEATPEAEAPELRASVRVESAFVRALPTLDAEVVGSVFEDNELVVVGRSLDGSWFQVRRPGRMANLGWILGTLIDWEFRAEDVPLTDFTVGVTGPTPLTADPGFAAYTLQGAVLRAEPLLTGADIGRVPFNIIVPVIARNQNSTWLQVNHLGNVGWINSVSVRRLPNRMDIPQAPNLPPLQNSTVLIIPPEVQLAELDRLREYVTYHRNMTASLESFWAQVLLGEVMPCEPPPFAVEYLYSVDNERAVPELEYLVPRVTEALDDINASIDAMYTCGVVNPRIVLAARNNAINARLVLDASLGLVDNVEAIIRDR